MPWWCMAMTTMAVTRRKRYCTCQRNCTSSASSASASLFLYIKHTEAGCTARSNKLAYSCIPHIFYSGPFAGVPCMLYANMHQCAWKRVSPRHASSCRYDFLRQHSQAICTYTAMPGSCVYNDSGGSDNENDDHEDDEYHAQPVGLGGMHRADKAGSRQAAASVPLSQMEKSKVVAVHKSPQTLSKLIAQWVQLQVRLLMMCELLAWWLKPCACYLVCSFSNCVARPLFQRE